MQLFQKEIDNRQLIWPVAVEVDSLDGVQQFVRCGFGAGITVKIPGAELPKGLKSPRKYFLMAFHKFHPSETSKRGYH